MEVIILKKENNNKKVTIVGLADCHGIESMHLESDKHLNIQHLSLRAGANAQRHAVVFKAILSKAMYDFVLHLCKVKQNHAGALKVLKNSANKENGVRIPDDFGGVWCDDTELFLGAPINASRNNWKLIPNPNLDPYR